MNVVATLAPMEADALTYSIRSPVNACLDTRELPVRRTLMSVVVIPVRMEGFAHRRSTFTPAPANRVTWV